MPQLLAIAVAVAGLTLRHAPLRTRTPVAAAFFEGAGLDREALAVALESQEKLAMEQAAAEAAEGWGQLESALPAVADDPAPVLTLYRDTNGWCPFCERVWLQLLVKGVPFNEELIDLRDKPAWYKELVPTTLVPAVRFADDASVVWVSNTTAIEPLVK